MKALKTLLVCMAASLPLLPVTGKGAQVAQARFHCWSLKFHQAEDSFGSTLNLSTISGPPNSELRPYSGASWASGLILDYLGGFPINGTLYLELPPFADVNDDGFDDFFDVSLAAGGNTTGFYQIGGVGGGTVSASWSREAGAKDGTCVLHLVDQQYGDLGSFRPVFEVLEYTGPLSYTPGTNTVSASLAWTQTGNPTAFLGGPAELVKVPSNRFNQLDLQPGGWTNEAPQELTFQVNRLHRNALWPTNYYGEIEFADGDPNTWAADYRWWMLSLDDLNDADRDGIPDFSDDPAAVTPPRRPRLTLARGETNLWLVVSGDQGRLHRIQETTNLLSPSWQTVLSLTVTNDPQTVSLPLPAAEVKFWRAWAE